MNKYSITKDDLRKVYALADMPEELLQFLLDHGEAMEFSDGEALMKTGELANHLYIIVEGEVSFYMDVNGKLVYYFTFGNNKTTGGVSGLLPYSRMKNSPGTSYAVGHLKG